MKKKLIFAGMLVVALAFAIVLWLLMPAQVAVQVGTDGLPSSLMEKPLAVALMFAVSALGAVLYYFAQPETAKKGIILVIAGYALCVITLFMNL